MDTSLCLLVIITIILSIHFIVRKKRKLPPGLPKIPIFGSIPWILRQNKHLIEIVKDDRRKYGDISCHDLVRFVTPS